MNERIYYSKEAEMRARRSGEQTREELVRGAGDFIGSARQTTDTLANQAGHAVEQVRERVEERINHA